MVIDVQCSKCSKKYRVKEALAGKTLKCKNCGSPLHIPEASASASASVDDNSDDDFAKALQDVVGDMSEVVSQQLPPRVRDGKKSVKKKRVRSEEKSRSREPTVPLLGIKSHWAHRLFYAGAAFAVFAGMIDTKLAQNDEELYRKAEKDRTAVEEQLKMAREELEKVAGGEEANVDRKAIRQKVADLKQEAEDLLDLYIKHKKLAIVARRSARQKFVVFPVLILAALGCQFILLPLARRRLEEYDA